MQSVRATVFVVAKTAPFIYRVTVFCHVVVNKHYGAISTVWAFFNVVRFHHRPSQCSRRQLPVKRTVTDPKFRRRVLSTIRLIIAAPQHPRRIPVYAVSEILAEIVIGGSDSRPALWATFVVRRFPARLARWRRIVEPDSVIFQQVCLYAWPVPLDSLTLP